MNRRNLTKAIGGAIMGAMLNEQSTAAEPKNPPPAEGAGDAAKFRIGMIIFERMTNTDFVGPCDVFARVQAAKVHVLAKTRDPITTDAGHRVLADMTLQEAPELDMLFVPGGPGTTAMMED